MLTERSAIWAKVERLRRALGQVGMPRLEVNRFGRVVDFAALEASDLASFERACGEAVRNRAPLIAPIRAMIRQAQDVGTQVWIVEMPMPPNHRKRFYGSVAWEEYRRYIQRLVQAEQAHFLIASDWVPPEDCFADALHLNATGAKSFSRRLAQEIAAATPRK